MDVGQMSAAQVELALERVQGGWDMLHELGEDRGRDHLLELEGRLKARQAVVGKPIRGVSLDVARGWQVSDLHEGPVTSPAPPSAREALDILWPGHGLPETARVLSIECGFNAFIDGHSVSAHVTGDGAEAWVAALPAEASAYALDGRIHLRRRDGQRMALVILDRREAP